MCPADWNCCVINQPSNCSSGRSFQRANTAFGHPPATVHAKAQPGIDERRRVRQPHQDQCRAVDSVHAHVMILSFKCEYVPAQGSRQLRNELGRVFGSGGWLFHGCGHSHLVVRRYDADNQQLDERHVREQPQQLYETERSTWPDHPHGPRHKERHGHSGCGCYRDDPCCRSSARRSGPEQSIGCSSGCVTGERNDHPESIFHRRRVGGLRSERTHHTKQRADRDGAYQSPPLRHLPPFTLRQLHPPTAHELAKAIHDFPRCRPASRPANPPAQTSNGESNESDYRRHSIGICVCSGRSKRGRKHAF